MDRIFPTFVEFAKMLKEKIIQPILNYIFYHIVATVFRKKGCKPSQVTVWKRSLISIFQDFNPVRNKLRIEFIPELFVKCIIEVILNHFFSEVCAAALIA